MTKLLERLSRTIETKRERLAYRWGPWLGRRIIEHSTRRAKGRLALDGPVSVMIDNTCVRLGRTHVTARVSRGMQEWGGQPFEAFHTARTPRFDANDSSRLAHEIKFLAGIAHLAAMRYLNLYTYSLLLGEREYQGAGYYRELSYFDHNVFKNVEIPSFDRRSFELGALIGSPFSFQNNRPNPRKRLEDAVERNKDERFLELFAAFGSHRKNSFDVHHIWFCEQNAIDYFLTTDKFILNKRTELLSRKTPFAFKTKIVSPSEWAAEYELYAVEPWKYSYVDNSWFVYQR